MKDIFEFEKENRDILEKFNEWVFLRMTYHFDYLKKQLFNHNNMINKVFITKIYDFLNQIVNIFYGFNNWFHKYNYFVITDSSQRKLVNGKYFDRLVDSIIKNLSIDKTLLIEIPNKKHINKKDIYTKNIVSFSLLKLVAILLKIIIKPFMKHSLFNQNTFLKPLFVDKIISKYVNTIIYQNILEKIFKILFKLYKIKILIISCYYGKEGIIKAAKHCGIKVIEVQHGVIGNIHPAYHSEIKLDNMYLPDVLLTFGKEGGYNNFIIKEVVPVGSFYLEYINKNFIPDDNLHKIINYYKYSFSVSLQNTCEKELIDFIKEIAKKKEYLFILIPRYFDKKYYDIILPSNIIFYPKLDFYNITMHCNIHITVYSTTALEAPSLGRPNILYNFAGLSEKYFSFLTSLGHTKIVNTSDDFYKAVDDLILLNDYDVKRKNSSIFELNYEDNIKNQLKVLLNCD